MVTVGLVQHQKSNYWRRLSNVGVGYILTKTTTQARPLTTPGLLFLKGWLVVAANAVGWRFFRLSGSCQTEPAKNKKRPTSFAECGRVCFF